MKHWKILKTLAMAALFAGFGVGAIAASVPGGFADVVAECNPSVVNVSSVKVVKNHGQMNPFGNDDLFRRFFGDQIPGGGEREFRSPSLGSGFVWDKEGYIITNSHVAKDSTELKVIFEGGREFEAKLIGADPDTDVALLKITPGDVELVPVKRGDSDKIRVGDWVLAIGNPFGFGHSVSAGIVSAKERIIGSGPYDDFLQTDAAINPGNSGGPLFDGSGRVVGINTAKIDGASSIGFAIPINMAAQVVAQMRENDGKVPRGWLGVTIQEVTNDIAKNMGMKKAAGALISKVLEGSPAEKAGIQRGDVITFFDGKEVERSSQLPYLVASHKPDSTVEVELIRKGEPRKIRVKLGTKDPNKMGPAESATSLGELGMSVQEITPDLRKALNIEAKSGVVVTGVGADTPAGRAGLRRGDVIVEVDREEVRNIDEFEKAIEVASTRETILLAVERKGQTSYIVIRNKDKK